MDINEELVKDNELLKLENGRLMAENAFLHTMAARTKSAFAILKASELTYWSTKTILEQNFSARIRGVLENADILTVADLLYYCRKKGGRDQLMKLRNLGEESYNELIAWMDKHGFEY